MKLKELVQAGFSQIEVGEYSTRSMDEFFNKVLEKRDLKNMLGFKLSYFADVFDMFDYIVNKWSLEGATDNGSSRALK